ncbi:MAG: lipopolysaccharide heptosyltransferase II [bacterium]
MNSVPDKTKSRHVVVAPNWIGDTAMAAPFLASLRASLPGGRIEVVSSPWTAGLLRTFPWVDEVHTIGGKDGRGWWKSSFSVRRKLGGRWTGTVWLLPNSFRSALLGLWIGGGRRVGYATDGRGFLLSRAVAPLPESSSLHLTDYYLGLLEAEGWPATHRRVQLPVTPEAAQFAEELISKKAPSGSGPLIGLHPGAAFGESKTWPAESFARLAKGLTASLGARVLILGGPGETELAGWVASASDGAASSIAGEDTLETLPGVLAGLDLLVSGDTGPLHVAALAGTKTISFFGPTDHRRTAPRGAPHRTLRRELECSPCFERVCPLGHHKCMKEITPEEVEEEVKEILRAGVRAAE